MPSAIQNFKAAVIAAFEGLAIESGPDADGSGLSFRLIDTLDEEAKGGQHREMRWAAPRSKRIAVLQEPSFDFRFRAVTLEVFWHKHPLGRNRAFDAALAAAENETSLLVQTFLSIPDQLLGDGVQCADLADEVEGPFETTPTERQWSTGGTSKALVLMSVFRWQVDLQES